MYPVLFSFQSSHIESRHSESLGSFSRVPQCAVDFFWCFLCFPPLFFPYLSLSIPNYRYVHNTDCLPGLDLSHCGTSISHVIGSSRFQYTSWYLMDIYLFTSLFLFYRFLYRYTSQDVWVPGCVYHFYHIIYSVFMHVDSHISYYTMTITMD